MSKPKTVVYAKREKNASFSTDALVHHNLTEFRFTFFDAWAVQKHGNVVKVMKDVVGEVVLTPQHAKLFLKALEANIQKYETTFGPIPDVPLPQDEAHSVEYGSRVETSYR